MRWPSDPSRRVWLIVWAIVAIYIGVRLSLLPADASASWGFTHDSAYIGIVARNVIAGLGLVNQAHWLVFLAPDSLPMPFHNANPLYPLAVAGSALGSGTDVAKAGLAVAAVAHGFLLPVIVWLLRGVGVAAWMGLGVGVLTWLFPPVFADSIMMLPDGLSTLLQLAAVAVLAAGRSLPHGAAAGIAFGLAWLTRSSAILLLPAIVVYVVLKEGRHRSARALVAFGLAAGVVASPWLFHTWRTWGSPLRSDASFYLLQDYWARAHAGSVERFWHSPQAPAGGLLSTVRSNPADVTWFWLRRIPETAYSLAAEWASWSKLALGAIGIQLAWLLWCWRRSLARAEILAAAVAFGTFATILNFRSVEVRYFGPITVFLALGLAFATVEAAAEGLRKRRVVPSMVALGALAYWTWAVGATDPSALTTARGPDRHGVEYRAIARNVQRRWVGGEPIVVGNLPYFYTFFTSAPALSIPDAGDEFLDSYLKRYHARFLLLTEDELLSWRRSWIGKDSVGPGLRLEARPGGAFLYRQDVMP